MQKQRHPIEFLAVDLPREFPVICSPLYLQKDHPITYLHYHNVLELGYCHEGSGVFMVGGKLLSFESKTVSFINASEFHLAQSTPGTVSRWTWIYLDPIRLSSGEVGSSGFLDPTPFAGVNFQNMFSEREYPEIQRVVSRLIEELRNRPARYEWVVRSLVGELMALMHRAFPNKGRLRQKPPEYDRIVPALNYAAAHFQEPVDVAKMARHCGLSLPYFRSLFLKAIGRTPREYWHDLRLRMASLLLRTGSDSILEISGKVGFETLSSFNRLFQNRYRMSPREYRRASTEE